MKLYHVRIGQDIFPDLFTYQELQINQIFSMFPDSEVKEISEPLWYKISEYTFSEETTKPRENDKISLPQETSKFTIDEYGRIINLREVINTPHYTDGNDTQIRGPKTTRSAKPKYNFKRIGILLIKNLLIIFLIASVLLFINHIFSTYLSLISIIVFLTLFIIIDSKYG